MERDDRAAERRAACHGRHRRQVVRLRIVRKRNGGSNKVGAVEREHKLAVNVGKVGKGSAIEGLADDGRVAHEEGRGHVPEEGRHQMQSDAIKGRGHVPDEFAL